MTKPNEHYCLDSEYGSKSEEPVFTKNELVNRATRFFAHPVGEAARPMTKAEVLQCAELLRDSEQVPNQDGVCKTCGGKGLVCDSEHFDQSSSAVCPDCVTGPSLDDARIAELERECAELRRAGMDACDTLRRERDEARAECERLRGDLEHVKADQLLGGNGSDGPPSDGKEAEELRSGIEIILSENVEVVHVDDLQALLDNTDARDSLAYLERRPVSQICRENQVQNCHKCDDLDCGDNMTKAEESNEVDLENFPPDIWCGMRQGFLCGWATKDEAYMKSDSCDVDLVMYYRYDEKAPFIDERFDKAMEERDEAVAELNQLKSTMTADEKVQAQRVSEIVRLTEKMKLVEKRNSELTSEVRRLHQPPASGLAG